jgi:hypothetical protein
LLLSLSLFLFLKIDLGGKQQLEQLKTTENFREIKNTAFLQRQSLFFSSLPLEQYQLFKRIQQQQRQQQAITR